jgi:hypothetical protein
MGRDYTQTSALGSQRQRSGEIDDNFHIWRLTLGAGVGLQRLLATDSRTSMLYRGSAQLSVRRLSVYGSFETGNDLRNKTLFSTNATTTTVAGASMTLGKNWEIQAEGYRNNLVTDLNPQSIFVLQGQGVSIPGDFGGVGPMERVSSRQPDVSLGQGRRRRGRSESICRLASAAHGGRGRICHAKAP